MRRAVALSSAALAAAVTCSTVVVAGAFAGTTTAGSIAEDIDAILADPALAGAHTGVSVVDAATGETVYQHLAGSRFVPASNTKLMTSTAAVELLGADYRFTTEVKQSGARRGEVLNGNLILRGTGDPTMLAADYDRLAADVAATGLRTVRGDLVADDTWFDRTRLGSDWGWDDEPFHYAAQTSALTVSPDTDYNPGSVTVQIKPAASAGVAPQVTVVPENGYLTIDNRAATVAAGGATTISADREHGGNTIVITGAIPVGAGAASARPSVWEPTGLAADVFARALAAHGVTVTGRTVLGAATPPGATTVASRASMPLSGLLKPFLKLSNNLHAELLTKAVGRKVANAGTWDAGLAAIAGYVGESDAYRQYDGSGLSRRDLVTPARIAELLVDARAEPWFGVWRDALPVAGDPDRLVGGTLTNRMRGTPAAGNVRAKTGTLPGVSGLSGYVTDPSGRELVFSVLVNANLAGVNPVLDRIAVALAGGGTGAAQSRQATAGRSAELECSWVGAC